MANRCRCGDCDGSLPATDFNRHGIFAVMHPESDEPTITTMANPRDVFSSMTEEEAEKAFEDLDNALCDLK